MVCEEQVLQAAGSTVNKVQSGNPARLMHGVYMPQR